MNQQQQPSNGLLNKLGWKGIAILAVALIIVGSALSIVPHHFAVGTWIVDSGDIANYLENFWDVPDQARMGLNLIIGRLATTELKIDLYGDNTYLMTMTSEPPTAVGKALRAVATDKGQWELEGVQLDGATIIFKSAARELVEPNDPQFQEAFRNCLKAQGKPRKFKVECINGNTVRWIPADGQGTGVVVRRR